MEAEMLNEIKEGRYAEPIPAPAASHHSRSERRALGKSLRNKIPRELHATWKRTDNRPDPVHLVEESDEGRLPELIALRHGRSATSSSRSTTWTRPFPGLGSGTSNGLGQAL
jgi:hypothetical protein